MKRKRELKKDITHQVKRMLKLLIPMLILYLILGGVILVNIRKQTVQNISEMSELYINELDNKFFRISRRILCNIMEDNSSNSIFQYNIEKIQENPNTDFIVNLAVRDLQEYFVQYSWEYGQEYHFFVYMEDLNRYYSLDIDGINLQKETVIESILQKTRSKGEFTYSIKQKWESLFLSESNYIYKVAKRKDVYLGCYVEVKDLLEPFEEIATGNDSYVQLVEYSGQVMGRLDENGFTANPEKAKKLRAAVICQEMKRAPFSVEQYISNRKILGVLMGALVSLLLLGAVLLAVGAGMLNQLRKYVMLPIKNFTSKLMKYEEDEETYDLSSNNLLELEQMDEQFRKMMRQIRKLKINLYEQELEKKKIEMDYLKLQIRPHFYLNCLNFIYSMIEFEQYGNAKKMATITADYLQYVFQNGLEKVQIGAELNHCTNYMQILLLRYKNKLEYYSELNEEVENCWIFPFLIQVFVENAAKHALTLDSKILISVTVFPEEREDGKYLNIYISDTGKGFSQDVLEKLSRREPLTDGQGHHLGIDNCLKRFRHFYGERGEIYFENSPLGGAIVDIHIPMDEADQICEGKESGIDEYSIGR